MRTARSPGGFWKCHFLQGSGLFSCIHLLKLDLPGMSMQQEELRARLSGRKNSGETKKQLGLT